MNYLASVPNRGDFAAEPCLSDHSLSMLTDGFQAIDKAPNGWTILARPDVPGNNGFMFSSFKDPLVNETMEIINKNIDSGHSGASYGWTMRNMESIAKDGWDHLIYAFRLSHLKSRLTDSMLSNDERTMLLATKSKLETMMEAAKKQYHNPSPASSPTVNPVTTVLQQAATVDRFIASAAAQGVTANPLTFANAIRKDPGMRRMIPDIDQQASAMSRFAEGKMSYAEMRSLCG
jgi:hypothetical protein